MINLHGNGNCPYYQTTRFSSSAILPNAQNIEVKLNAKYIHEDIDSLQRMKEIPSYKYGLVLRFWYILWQVVRVVHNFVSKCVCWAVGEESTGTNDED